jgi:DNA-directed RNA polymerase specialized sigma24 family protein
VIETLAKKDDYWRRIAYNICKDKTLADDLVQDMYLKLQDCKKQINDFYVVIVIRNLFLDHIKQTKKRGHVNLDSFYDLECGNKPFEVDDEEKDIIDNMYWVAKGYFELSQDMSLREMAKELNTNYVYIYRVMKKAKENIK